MTQQRKPFSTITLSTGESCSIFEPRAFDIMRATFEMARLDSQYSSEVIEVSIKKIKA